MLIASLTATASCASRPGRRIRQRAELESAAGSGSAHVIIAWIGERKPDEAFANKSMHFGRKAKPRPPHKQRPPTAQLLERVVTTFALIDANAKQLVDLCSKPHALTPTPTFAWLTDEKTPAIVRNNLRLWLGKWLAQERFYDEAMAQLADLQPADVVDPASLLFYQSVCHHWMLHKTDGLKSSPCCWSGRKPFRDGTSNWPS